MKLHIRLVDCKKVQELLSKSVHMVHVVSFKSGVFSFVVNIVLNAISLHFGMYDD